MRTSFLKGMFVTVLCLMFAHGAQAAVIYSQTMLNTESRGNFQFDGQYYANDFSTTSNAIVDIVRWFGSYYEADPTTDSGSFTIQFYASSGSLPTGSPLLNEVVSATIVDSGIDLLGRNLYEYSADITDLALTAGNEYWMTVYSNDAAFNYAWAQSLDGSSDGAVSSVYSSGWSSTDDSLANHLFSLEGDETGGDTNPVPEPATLLLVGGGLFGFFLKRR